MTFGKPQPRRSAVGIDVGTRHINAIQMEGSGAHRRIAAAMALPRSTPSQALSIAELRPLPGILKRAGFSGNKIVLATPLEKQFAGVFDIPASAASSCKEMARMELARSSRCAPDLFEVECWQLPDGVVGGTGMQVMAVACRHDDAGAFLDLFEGAGFDVDSLDLRAAALARAAGLLAGEGRGIAVILELNWQATSLVLVYRGEIIFERKLADADLQRIYDALVGRLQLDAELADYLLLEAGPEATAGDAPVQRQARALLSGWSDGLISELSASIAYATQHFADVAIDSLLLCGDGATAPALDRRMGAAINAMVRRIAPIDLFAGQEQYPGAAASGALVMAMGLIV